MRSEETVRLSFRSSRSRVAEEAKKAIVCYLHAGPQEKKKITSPKNPESLFVSTYEEMQSSTTWEEKIISYQQLAK